MFKSLLRASAPFALLLSASLAAQPAAAPIAPADLMRHIRVLAGDDFQGRAPGTEGERRTIAYIAEQFAARGLEPAAGGASWFQQVRLVERTPIEARANWSAGGRAIPFDAADIVLLGREASERLADAPVIFAGHGARLPDRGIDQLAGADVRGAVVLIMLEGPRIPGFPSLAERRQAVSDAGAAAVIAIVGPSTPWPSVRQLMAGQTATRLDATPVPAVTGAIPIAAAQRLIEAAGGNFEQLLNAQPGPSFRAVPLALRASLEVTTRVNRYTTNNVVGRLRGTGGGGANQSVMLLSHWDHLGICRPEGEPDRICNGAVDNASGIASLIEIAGRLGSGPRPARDILFLATTAEESGLLGAEYFAGHPVVPAASIVAAINMDTVAIHPAGLPVATIGRGISPALDQAVEATVRAAGRQLDPDDEAAVMVQRQDGWKLNQAGIPTIMVSGNFSDMSVLGGFLEGRYHKPDDQADGRIVLDGAAEDANLLVALTRRLGDPAAYQPPARTAE